jgi:hypothetical protein
LDDIIIFARSLEEHLARLNKVLQRLRDANLKIKLDKCHFLKIEVVFLGFRMTANRLAPDINKVQPILSIPPPKYITQLRSFIGLVSYYRRFIPNMSHIAASLFKLLRQDVSFAWTAQCQVAMDTLI